MTLDAALHILGLSRDVSMEEAKSAWKRAARRYHPDLARSDWERHRRHRLFVRAQNAWELVMEWLDSAVAPRQRQEPGPTRDVGGDDLGFGTVFRVDAMSIDGRDVDPSAVDGAKLQIQDDTVVLVVSLLEPWPHGAGEVDVSLSLEGRLGSAARYRCPVRMRSYDADGLLTVFSFSPLDTA